MNNTEEITRVLNTVSGKLKDRPALAELFQNCYPNTLNTTVKLPEPQDPFVITGDIPAMWLRDSSAQVRHYLDAAEKDEKLAHLIGGLIRRQMFCINIDAYANAFNQEKNGHGHQDDKTLQSPWIWERKYEVDSLCYPVQLSYLYWKKCGRTDCFDRSFLAAAHKILAVWRTEQHHEASEYTFERTGCVETDTLPNAGRGTPVAYTGMTWSGFRPSDDACTYGYLVPSNMFAVVVLGYLAEILREIYHDEETAQEAERLREEIQTGIQNFAIFDHPKYGKIYAYETDGLGNYNLMDDANVPSLLSLPYLGYCAADDPIYQNTRKFILSKDNPFYFEGKAAQGIGSPHTPSNYIWPISLAVQGLTSTSRDEQNRLLHMLETTNAKTGFMHESFDAENPEHFTREWFAWANSIFSEFLLKYTEEIAETK